jgi:hypothetical protein
MLRIGKLKGKRWSCVQFYESFLVVTAIIPSFINHKRWDEKLKRENISINL